MTAVRKGRLRDARWSPSLPEGDQAGTANLAVVQVPGLRWRPATPREVAAPMASTASASGRTLVRRAGILGYCLAFPVTDVTVAATSTAGSAMRPFGWVLLGTAAYTPFYLRHVWYFLHGRKAPHSAWTLAAMAAVMAGFTPLAQAFWLKAYTALAVALLTAVPWSWSLPGVAILAAVQVPLGAAFGTSPFIPLGGVYFPVTLLWRTSAVFVPLWLLQALRQLQTARRELAADAVLQERVRVADRLRATVGAALDAITACGQRSAALAAADPGLAAPEVAALARLSRRTLADARQELRGLH